MSREQLRRVGKRTLAITIVGGLLVIATAVNNPRDSAASPEHEAGPWFNTSSFPKIGELVGRNYVLRLFAAPEGTLYTVCSSEGKVLAEDLTGDEVMRLFPDIDVNLHAGPDPEVHAIDGADFVIMSADRGL